LPFDNDHSKKYGGNPKLMSDPFTISGVVLEFDPHRGGFYLDFASRAPTERCLKLFGGLIAVYLTENLLLQSVRSDWDHGRMLLKSLYHEPGKSRRELSGGFRISGDQTRSGPVWVRQNPKYFEIWFGSLPVESSPDCHDPNTRVSLWFAAEPVPHPYRQASYLGDGSDKPAMVRTLIGIRLQFNCLPASYPVGYLDLRPGDIK
jgi:hypothetical protein